LQAAHCEAEDACCVDAGAEDLVLVIGSFDAVDAAACEVDDCECTFEMVSPWAEGAAIPALSFGARDGDDSETLGSEVGSEGDT
jgi:hypothetical protein